MKNQIDYAGELFLDRLFKDLYKSKEVLNGNRNPSQKVENIRRYMERLEELHKRVNESPREHDKDLLKQLYYDKYIIKEDEVPESYYIHQQEILLERGYGHVDITKEMKKELASQIIEEQKKSLDYWIDYFISSDTSMYPMWAKYWAFQGMLKLGSYSKETRQFSRRTKGTIAPFVELNQEALALSIDVLLKYLNRKEINDSELEKIIESGVFGKIYAYELMYLDKINKEKSNSDAGVWIKYPQGSDHMKLVKSIQGKGTGWCTAGEETAKSQLSNGDVYVYYSFDSNNEPTIPRIAIRMEKDKIAEIRGVAKDQNIEPEMENVVYKKLEEFPDRDEYKQKVEDMRILTQIYKEYQTKQLTIEELRFLYEVDRDIKGFGYQKDPRIEEIKTSRNIKKDLAIIFDCKENEVGIAPKNLEFNDIDDIDDNLVVYYGKDIKSWKLSLIKKVKFPKVFIGNLSFDNLKNVEELILPEIVYGNIDLSDLISPKVVILPKKINGYLAMNNLKTVEGLEMPIINGGLYLKGLLSSEGLKLPENINGDLDLSSLKNIDGLVFPKYLKGSLDISNVEVIDGVILPKVIDESLYLDGLTNVKCLKFPEIIGDDLSLDSLENVDEELQLPKTVKGNVYLDELRSMNNIKLPEKIGGTLCLRSIIYWEHLILPENFSCSAIRTEWAVIKPEDYYLYQKKKNNGNISIKNR